MFRTGSMMFRTGSTVSTRARPPKPTVEGFQPKPIAEGLQPKPIAERTLVGGSSAACIYILSGFVRGDTTPDAGGGRTGQHTNKQEKVAESDDVPSPLGANVAPPETPITRPLRIAGTS